MNIQHTNYDTDFQQYYVDPPGNNPVFTSADISSYMRAIWTPDLDYNIDTGKLIKYSGAGDPYIKEFFFPDFDIRGDKIFSIVGGSEEVVFPYLANVPSSPPSTNKRFTILANPYYF